MPPTPPASSIGSATGQDNLGNVDEGLDVVDHGWLAKQPALGRERRLIARLAAVTFDRIEKSGFFAANVGARAAADFDVKGKAAAQNIFP